MSRRADPARTVAAVLATLITLVCVVMAAAAAFERAPAGHERWLITALASLIVLCLHLIPALLGRTWSRALLACIYAPCLLVTLYGHAHFFMAAQAAQGVARAAATPSTSAAQAQALQAQLGAIAARPLATVAADVATAEAAAARTAATLERCRRTDATRCSAATAADATARAKLAALTVESEQATKADGLRDRIAALSAGDDQARSAAALDPVDAELATLLGVQPRTMGLLMALLQSLLAEVLAGALWVVALGERRPASREASQTTLPTAPTGAASVAVGNAVAGSARRLVSLLFCANRQVLQTSSGMQRMRWVGTAVAPAMRDPPLFVTPC